MSKEKITQDDLEDMAYFLDDYLKFFKKKDKHIKCDTCKIAKELLKKIKKLNKK